MHVNRETARKICGQLFVVLLATLMLFVWQRQTQAQTVLSPAPFMPIQNRSNPSTEIPTAAEALSQEPDEETADEKPFHIPLVLNDSVENQIEYFTTRGRAIFQAWLDRSARYLPIMKKIFREFNLPEDLVYVAMIESGFNPHAVSEKKAVGPWQFMRATAREYGLNANHWIDERRDPVKSTRAAAAHFKDLYNVFGSWPMALASYNAGMGTIQGAAHKARSDDFWELRASRFIRMETQDYVPRYMAALIIAKNPVTYGFTDPEAEPFEFEEVVIQKITDLRRIANSIGCSYDKIRELNPELLQASTAYPNYILRIPPGSKSNYEKHIANASRRERKLREAREQARSGGVLFSRMASSKRSRPPKHAPAAIVSPFAAQLEMNEKIMTDTAGRNRPNTQALHDAGRPAIP